MGELVLVVFLVCWGEGKGGVRYVVFGLGRLSRGLFGVGMRARWLGG